MNTPGTPTGGPLPVQRETLVRTALSAAYDGMFAWSIRNGVGESPVWDADAGRLFWIDMLRHLSGIPGEAVTNRLNEGKVSPGGRWFVFGSIDDRASNKQPVGALYGPTRTARCSACFTV